MNIKESLSATLLAQKLILDQIRDPQHSHKAPPILERKPKRNEVSRGFDLEVDKLPPGDESLIESLMSEEFATQWENGMVSTDTTKTAAHLTFAATLSSKASRKRVGEDLKQAEPPHKI